MKPSLAQAAAAVKAAFERRQQLEAEVTALRALRDEVLKLDGEDAVPSCTADFVVPAARWNRLAKLARAVPASGSRKVPKAQVDLEEAIARKR